MLRILALGLVLLMALVTSGPGNRFLMRRGGRAARRAYPSAGPGAPFAVLFGSLPLPAPAMLLLDQERAMMTQNWVLAVAVVLAAALVAFALARRLSPPWWQPWHRWIAMRAGLLLVVVVGLASTAAAPGVPLWSQLQRVWLISLIATAGYLACWRVIDTGYWPLLLVRDGVVLLLVAAGFGGWLVGAGGSLRVRTADLGQLTQTLLLLAVATIGLSAVLAGAWRLRRWLREGPPFWPRPPGVENWPPEPGEVWNAAIIHDDGNHKDRPVLVWDREPNYARVLTVTSVDKSARAEHYLRLPLAEWHRVLTKDAWLSLELTAVPYTDFRSIRGECPERSWAKIGRRTVREQREPSPAFAFRHRLHSAMNRRAGVDARTLPGVGASPS